MERVLETTIGPARVLAAPASAEDSEEERWVEAARSGDPEGFRRLMERYRDRAVRLATHILRRPSEAEDAAQEAFIRAFRNLDAYRSEGRFYTWLYQIVVRVCLDRRRRSRWSAECEGSEILLEAVGTVAAPDARLLVEALLDRLSPPMRAALVLRELDGLEYEEIAAVLRIPIGTVRSRLNTARAQFRVLWLAANEECESV